jgi:protein NUD1
MNPSTLPYYLPLLMKDIPGASERSEEAYKAVTGEDGSSRGSAPWHELDAKFRNGLPDITYVKRLIYRGLVMRGCQKLRELDGVKVEMSEVLKAEGLLRQMERAS